MLNTNKVFEKGKKDDDSDESKKSEDITSSDILSDLSDHQFLEIFKKNSDIEQLLI